MNIFIKNKKILLFLITIISGVAYLYFVLIPQLNNMNDLKKDIKILKKGYHKQNTFNSNSDKLNFDIKKCVAQFGNFRSIYPVEMKYEDILVQINDKAICSGISVKSISFSGVKQLKSDNNYNLGESELFTNLNKLKSQQLAKKLGLLPEKGKEYKGSIPNGQIYCMKTQVIASGSNQQAKSFIKALEESQNKITVDDMTINAQNQDYVDIKMSINFIGVMDRYATELQSMTDGIWQPTQPAYKSNIFSNMIGNQDNNQYSSSFLDYYKSNFTMKVVSYEKGIAYPSVSFLAKGIKDIVEIYGDNSGRENVDLYLEEKEGKFRFSFKTEKESSPDPNMEMVEFNPIDGQIKLFINSEHRKGPNDNSGMNLNIRNITSKPVIVKIKNDDPTNPRVVLAGGDMPEGGPYSVERIN